MAEVPAEIKELVARYTLEQLQEMKQAAKDNVFRQRGALRNVLDELGLLDGKPSEGLRFIENSIGAIANALASDHQLTSKQAVELKQLVQALWEDTGITNPVLSFYRDTGLMAALGQFSSAITQLQDIGWSYFENGFWHTSRAYAKALVKKSAIRRNTIAPDIMPEFSHTQGASWILNHILQWTGMAYLDTAGKEGLANASVSKMQAEIKKAQNGDAKAEAYVRERLGQVFGGDLQTVWADLLQGDPNNKTVKQFAHFMVSEFQPLNRLETPEAYKGNARILYMLKTYQVKQLNNYRSHLGRRLKKAMVNKDYKSAQEAMQAIMTMAFWLAFLGAGTNWIKDWIYGRETDAKDLSVDVLGQLVGVSRYDTYNIRREGVSSALMKRLVPQNKIIDNIYKDLTSPDSRGMRSAGLFPVLGKFYYWREGRGAGIAAGDKNTRAKRAKKKSPAPLPSKGFSGFEGF